MNIKKFDKQDLSKHMDLFCNLYHKVFTAAANKEIIEQRYLENPYNELLMYVAIEDEKIIANYSAVPIRIVVNGVEKKAALSLNTMTDPDYTGKGLFTKLASALYEYLADNGYAMIIGFPNFMSNRTFNSRLGWTTILEIPTLKLSLEEYQDVSNNDEVLFSNSFDDLCDNEIGDCIRVALSKEYVAWRFKNNKEKKYNTIAVDKDNWLIYQYYNNEINITEIACKNKSNERELIQKIIALGKNKGYAFVTTWCMTNTELHNYLEKVGFRLSSPIRTFGLRCFDDSISEIILDPRNWKIQMGDDNTY